MLASKAAADALIPAEDSAAYVTRLEADAAVARESVELKDEISRIRGLITHWYDKATSGELTEYVQGELQPVSDVTRLKMLTELNRTLAAMAKTKWDISSGDYVPADEFLLYIQRLHTFLTRTFPGQENAELIFKCFDLAGMPKSKK